ncbi:hypothetical protein DV736_g6503, partial [Chaetothyriales sp. CBS 134916]
MPNADHRLPVRNGRRPSVVGHLESEWLCLTDAHKSHEYLQDSRNSPRAARLLPGLLTDAVAALPCDYRRHVSLLKEVDAKAYSLEADLQQLLTQFVTYTSPLGAPPTPQTDEVLAPSAADSTAGQLRAGGARQVFHDLRATLMQIMVTMDEKNHVINNANEELSWHLRHFHSIWPHIADEISEEAMFGSLKHWAYTDTNANKESTATTRQEAAADVALMHKSDMAQRSESRREAGAAKSRRNLARIEAGFADINHNSKNTGATEKRRVCGRGEKAMTAALGLGAMLRESSQQDGGRPPSASVRNGVSAGTLEQHGAATTAAGRTGNDVKNTATDSTVSKSIEDETPNGADNDAPTRGAASLACTASKQSGTRDFDNSSKPADSPQLGGAVLASRSRARSSGTTESGNAKSKRAARPRVKDHRLHDSLSPKGLPLKRSHKEGASLLSQLSQQIKQCVKPESENITTDYGEMIACDNLKCPGEWFHFECIGLKNTPKSKK